MAAPLEIQLKQKARELGFDAVAITLASLDDETAERLRSFVDNGFHGDMQWMPDSLERRSAPTNMWPGARSAIVLGVNYGPEDNPLERLQKRGLANISVYAQNRDYHDLVKGRLKTLAQWFVAKTGLEVKVFVDTAPLMEKPLGQKAGLGWQGKHTNLVSKDFGSWMFLGVILTEAGLQVDTPAKDTCGSCQACLDICPTKAFPKPYVLDARRCISYLTIEHQGMIDVAFRKAMGNRIYGCDDCLSVCPWNKFAKKTKEMKLKARPEIASLALRDLLQMDDATFRKTFSGSPVKRTGRVRMLRNALMAAGNSKDTLLVPIIADLLDDPAELVRASAVWAIRNLLEQEEIVPYKEQRYDHETSAMVIKEWQRELPIT